MSLDIEDIERMLPIWIEAKVNVLLVGRHGVGKTSMILEAFAKKQLRLAYFSGATMDPWTDLVGIPRSVPRKDGSYVVEYIRPEQIQDDIIDAILIDEFNRSHKKVRNAAMELIQFRSINGKKLNNVKMVWACINPDDDDMAEYDVEKLDKATKDRFHRKVIFPYQCNHRYFERKFLGKFQPTAIKGAIEWWNGLPEPIRIDTSPRRLEYALEAYLNNEDLHYSLDAKTNVGKLITLLKAGSVEDNLKYFMDSKNVEDAEAYLGNENNYSGAIEIILRNDDMLNFFLPLMEKEKITSLVSDTNKTLEVLTDNLFVKRFAEVAEELLEAKAGNVTGRLMKRIKHKRPEELPENLRKHSDTNFEAITEVAPAAYSNSNATGGAKFMEDLKASLDIVSKDDTSNTDSREKAYTQLRSSLPKKMKKEEFTLALQVVDTLVQHTHFGVLRKWPEFLGVVNHVAQHIEAHAKSELAASPVNCDETAIRTKIMREYGEEFKRISGKLKTAKMYDGFYLREMFTDVPAKR